MPLQVSNHGRRASGSVQRSRACPALTPLLLASTPAPTPLNPNQAAGYQIPSCGYSDPLGGYGPSDLADELAWDVDLPTKFCLQARPGGAAVASEGRMMAGWGSTAWCQPHGTMLLHPALLPACLLIPSPPFPPRVPPCGLQGGPAVEGLISLVPWFGQGVQKQGDMFCADGLSTSYTPLEVRGQVVGANAVAGSMRVLLLEGAEHATTVCRGTTHPPMRRCLSRRPTARRGCMCPPTPTPVCRSPPTAGMT